MGNELPTAIAKVLTDHPDVRFTIKLGGSMSKWWLGNVVLLNAEQQLTPETKALLNLTSTEYDQTTYLRATGELTTDVGEVSLLKRHCVEAIWALHGAVLAPLARQSPLTDTVLPQVQALATVFTAMRAAIPQDADVTRLGAMLGMVAGKQLLTHGERAQ